MSTRVYPYRVGSMNQSVNNYIRRRGPVQDSTPQRDDNPMSPGLLAFNELYGNRNYSGSSRSSGNNSSRSLSNSGTAVSTSNGSSISDRASRIREENRLLSERASVLSEQNKLLLSQKAARVRSENRTLMMRYNNLTTTPRNPPPAPPPRNRAPRRSGRNLAVPLQNYQPVNSRRPPPVPPRYNRAPIPPTRTTSLTQRTPQRPLVSNPRRRLDFGSRRRLNLGGDTPNFSGVSSVNGDFSSLNGSFGLNNVTPVNLSQYNNLTLPTPSPRRPRQRSNIPFSPQITSTPNRSGNKDVTNSLSQTGVSNNSVAMRTNPNISKPVLTNGGGKIDDSEDFEKPRKRARLILPIPFSKNPLTTKMLEVEVQEILQP